MDISDTALLIVACVMASVLTQIASNAATANIITPILIVLSQKVFRTLSKYTDKGFLKSFHIPYKNLLTEVWNYFSALYQSVVLSSCPNLRLLIHLYIPGIHRS